MAPELEAVRTAIVKGLPSRVRWWLDGSPLDFDFSDAARGFRRISNGDIVGGDIDESCAEPPYLWFDRLLRWGRSFSLGCTE